MRIKILSLILVIELSIIGFYATEAFPSVPHITEPYQPMGNYYRDWAQTMYQVDIQKEIIVIPARVQIKNDFEVIDNMKEYHYHIIEIHLVQEKELREHCINKRAVACLNNWQIFIINGMQGERPNDEEGGCSVLYHELRHASGVSLMTGNHDEMKALYPNERCAVA